MSKYGWPFPSGSTYRIDDRYNSKPEPAKRIVWVCDYCKSFNDLSEIACTQCGAITPLPKEKLHG